MGNNSCCASQSDKGNSNDGQIANGRQDELLIQRSQISINGNTSKNIVYEDKNSKFDNITISPQTSQYMENQDSNNRNYKKSLFLHKCSRREIKITQDIEWLKSKQGTQLCDSKSSNTLNSINTKMLQTKSKQNLGRTAFYQRDVEAKNSSHMSKNNNNNNNNTFHSDVNHSDQDSDSDIQHLMNLRLQQDQENQISNLNSATNSSHYLKV